MFLHSRQAVFETTRAVCLGSHNRIQKVLEGANIKLSSVASNTLGKSGRAMLEAMIQGENSSEALSKLARGRLKSKMELLSKDILISDKASSLCAS
ncbi:hypothetical protein BM613_09710 [Sulfoacidibacillus thermotolerans]|uniref:Uncharacterized protein n=1 Tax=Sulfoacidibacillus thermotolerans TaxID=1765684 RepID=A0A2U3D7K2_SULT2|nr:hypothetical protein BM613_09710 [Sulfoacidibacillus thermotolerans]